MTISSSADVLLFLRNEFLNAPMIEGRRDVLGGDVEPELDLDLNKLSLLRSIYAIYQCLTSRSIAGSTDLLEDCSSGFPIFEGYLICGLVGLLLSVP
jgi:hypothetical protein